MARAAPASDNVPSEYHTVSTRVFMGSGFMNKPAWLFCLWLLAAPAIGEPFKFSVSSTDVPADIAKAMPSLATQLIGEYRDSDQSRYLDNLFRLQLVAGLYPDAAASLAQLGTLRAGDCSPGIAATDVQYEIFARAKILETSAGMSFDAAFARSFRETLSQLDDKSSAIVARAMSHYS